METREEKLATWADSSVDCPQSLRFLEGSIPLILNDPDDQVRFSQDQIELSQIGDHVLNAFNDDGPNLWHFKVISFPQLQLGRLRLSIPKPVFQKIQDSWNLHPHTIEVFLSNNGVFTTFHCSRSGRTSFLLKVANSRSTGFDSISVACDPSRRTTYVLYHHLKDEDSVFATLLSTLERCIDPLFFVAALYRSHHQQIETYRNTIDDAILKIERQTGLGVPASLMGRRAMGRRASLDEVPLHFSAKRTIQQLGYCQSDVAIIKHVARCCLECGDWLVQVIDEKLRSEHGGDSSADHCQRDLQLSKSLRMVRLMNREDVEYMRRRSKMTLSQIQQIGERTQSQTNFVSISIKFFILMRRLMI